MPKHRSSYQQALPHTSSWEPLREHFQMVLGLLLLAGIPTGIGVTTGVSKAGGDHEEKARSAELAKECLLSAYCDSTDPANKWIHGKPLLMHEGRIVIGAKARNNATPPPGNPFKAFYTPFPSEEEDPKPRALVCLSLSQSPEVGFLYVDRDTMQLHYGNKSMSTPQIHGSWATTEDYDSLLLADEELFVAVKDKDGVWSLYWDEGEDGSRLPRNRPSIAVSIERKVLEGQ